MNGMRLQLLLRSIAVCAALAPAFFGVVSHAQTAGTFDTSFGVGGKVTNLTAMPPAGESRARAMTVQTDGKILLAGGCQTTISSENVACIARLNADGQLDASFVGPSGNAAGRFLLPFAESASSFITAIAVGSDGKITVAAECSNGVQVKLCTMRLTSSGALDSTYNGGNSGPGGELQFALPSGNAFSRAVKVQPDGKTVFLFLCGTKFCFQRLNINGSMDTSFDGPNGNGAGSGVGTGDGRFELDLFGISAEYPADLAIAADGKLVATGQCNAPSLSLCVVRLNANGSYDASFDGPSGGGNGRAAFAINAVDGARGQSVAIQPDGKIVVGGYCGGTSESFRMCGARLTSTGSFDPEFSGTSGNTLGRFRFAISGVGHEELRRLLVQDDGRILLAGICENGVPNTNGFDFCFARLNSDGSFDASFDGPGGSGNGRFRVGIAQDMDVLEGLALRPDGRIVAGGTCSDTCGGSCGGNAFCVAQFSGGTQGYETCSLDIDGDGVVGVNDAVVHARIGLGLRGAALFEGLTFSANGLRPTPTAIRSYLISHCGRVSP